ncbi:MAG: glycosyltransferase family 2 protein [Ruthenibacterium sp.]
MRLRLKRCKELLAFLGSTVQKEGLFVTIKRGFAFIKRRLRSKKGRFYPSKALCAAQKAVDTTAWPTLCFCVPLYNTPEKFLTQLLDSVQNQTCQNWQLCLANASDATHENVAEIVKKYDDARIKYCKIENEGISANTNAAAKLATGDYLCLADHDDVLSPNAVFEMAQAAHETGAAFLYSDEALFSDDILRPIVGHFKPDFAPDYLNCCNYICHLSAFKRDLFWKVGGLAPACDGSQDHDLFLKLSEYATPLHIPKVLYYWRVHANSTSGGIAAKPYVSAAAKRAIESHLARTGVAGTVKDGLFPSTYRVEYRIANSPLVSILIPNKDHVDDLKKALASVFTKTAYPHYEVLVLENNSTQAETFAYYKKIEHKYANLRVCYYEGDFNFSAINNFGRKAAKGDYLLLLNNDVEVLNGAWLTEMLSLCVQPQIGAVGAKLYYPDDTVQHGGIVTGLGGYAGHSHKYARRGAGGYMFRLGTVQNFSACTAACLLVKTSVFDAVGGLDEGFTVAFNDVDFCLRIRAAGYRIAYTPYAELYHYESKSRGLDEKDKTKRIRFDAERARLKERYGDALLRDPYYNPNLTLDREDFSESDALPKEVFPQ